MRELRVFLGDQEGVQGVLAAPAAEDHPQASQQEQS